MERINIGQVERLIDGATLDEVNMPMSAITPAIDTLQHLLRRAHQPSRLLHGGFALLIDTSHPICAHMRRHRADLGSQQELNHLGHVPGRCSLGMFVHEVPMFPKLHGVDLETESNMGLAGRKLSGHHSRISLPSADLL